MRAQIITGCSGIGLAAVSYAVPVVFPHVAPWVAKGILAFGVILIVVAFALWLSGLTSKSSESEFIQTSHGSQSPNFGTVGGNVTITNFPTFDHSVKKHYATWDDVPVSRDVGLAEALAYAEMGEWGRSFFDAASIAANRADEQLTRFRQLAHDGTLTVWGKLTDGGVFEKIPPNHWIFHNVEWFDLLRGNPRTETTTPKPTIGFRDIMVSKAEFQREWPHA